MKFEINISTSSSKEENEKVIPLDEEAILSNEEMDNKGTISINSIEEQQRKKSKLFKILLAVIAITSYLLIKGMYKLAHYEESHHHHHHISSSIDECPATAKIIPCDNFEDADIFFTPEYRNLSLDAWSGVAKIPSISYDDLNDVGKDDRWLVFGDLHKFLEQTFPLVYKYAEVEYINTYGLLFTFKGKNPDLKPAILMAHQDVVPVPEETVSRWTHPPFGGYFDGEFLWGRGVSDDKNSLVAIFEAVSALLKQGFEPERTLILSFGFDEEVSGHRGAGNLAAHLEKKLGTDSTFVILDEGGNGIQKSFGQWFGFPATGEKGYIDLRITLTTTGGHSSVPPDHTGIGIISQLITAIEASPYESDITKLNPFYYHLQCLAKYGDEQELGSKLKKDIQNLDYCPAAKKRVIENFSKNPSLKYVMTTSQAVDIIKGGLKINALPEQVVVDVNHRVAIESSLDFVKEKVTAIATAVAEDFDFAVRAFGNDISGSANSKGLFDIASVNELDIAPVTPNVNNPTWDLVGGTLRQVFEDVNGGIVDGPIIVAPSVMTGNTDTRYYWNLSKNIYRFSPGLAGQSANIHAVDEHATLDGHISGVAFYYNFIRNVDAYSYN